MHTSRKERLSENKESSQSVGAMDTRQKVEDTSKYPFNAIALLEMEFFSDSRKYSGSAFLADSNILVTVAHNVRDENNCPARSINVLFGLNGIDAIDRHKNIKLKGRDFRVPDLYKKPMDDNDIAWVNLKDLYNGSKYLNWSLNDLPRDSLLGCHCRRRIP